MIDFIKLEINCRNTADALRKNPLLKLESTFDNSTGVLKKEFGKYLKMKFTIHASNKVYIQGSLHYLFNSGEHNYNDFTFSNLLNTIDNFCELFQIDPHFAIIRSFEFGVNLKIDINPSNLLAMIVCYGNDSVNNMTISGSDGRVSHQTNYIVKVYNKSLQYKLSTHVLRIEKKVIRMRKVQHLSILTLYHLKSPEKVNQLGKLLFEMFDKLIIHEPIQHKKLTRSELKTYEQCGNPRYWVESNRSTRYKVKKRYNDIVKRSSLYKIKESLNTQLVAKWTELLKKR